MQSWRWIHSGAADGASHMSVDAALLENPSRLTAPAVRVYRWDPFCISLGKHQSDTAIDLQACRREGVDVVRRPTGGRAVLHSDETTYAVVLPRASEWGHRPKGELYRMLSEAITRGLVRLGLPVAYEKRSLRPPSPADGTASMSCFSSSARWEILLDGKKLVGSAQRIAPTGLLQHGSILTGNGHSRLFRFLRGSGTSGMRDDAAVSIEAFAGHAVSFGDIANALKWGFETVFSVRLEASELTQEEKRLAETLRPTHAVFSSGKSQ